MLRLSREKFYPISVLIKNLKQKLVVIDNNWWQTVITKLLLTWYYCKELKILRIQSKYVQSQVSTQRDVDCKNWNQGTACFQWPIQNLIERKSIGTKINLIQTRYGEIYKGLYKKIILFANINGKHLESQNKIAGVCRYMYVHTKNNVFQQSQPIYVHELPTI